MKLRALIDLIQSKVLIGYHKINAIESVRSESSESSVVRPKHNRRIEELMYLRVEVMEKT